MSGLNGNGIRQKIRKGTMIRQPYDKTKRTLITHSPFTVEQDGIHVSCSDVGKLTFSRAVRSPEGNLTDEVDEVDNIPASLIFKIHTMLRSTRKFKQVPREEGIARESGGGRERDDRD